MRLVPTRRSVLVLLLLSLGVLGCRPAHEATTAPDATPASTTDRDTASRNRSNVRPPTPPSIDVTALERAIHERVNEARRTRDRSPLAWRDRFHRLARTHSRDMASRDFFSHTNPAGENVNDRAEALGVQCTIATANTRQNVGFAENLFTAHLYHSRHTTRTSEGEIVDETYAWKSATEIVDETVRGWLQSRGHRRNLLSPRYRVESIGVAVQGTTYYVTQVLC